MLNPFWLSMNKTIGFSIKHDVRGNDFKNQINERLFDTDFTGEDNWIFG